MPINTNNENVSHVCHCSVDSLITISFLVTIEYILAINILDIYYLYISQPLLFSQLLGTHYLLRNPGNGVCSPGSGVRSMG